MALKQTVRLYLIEKNPYAIMDQNGQNHTGFIFEGFDAQNRLHRFTSAKDEYPVYDGAEYQEKNSRDFILYGRTDLNGRVKWSDFEKEKRDMTKPRPGQISGF